VYGTPASAISTIPDGAKRVKSTSAGKDEDRTIIYEMKDEPIRYIIKKFDVSY
jgi:hypothetical protein